LTVHRVELRWGHSRFFRQGLPGCRGAPSTRVWTGIVRAKLVAFGEITRVESSWTPQAQIAWVLAAVPARTLKPYSVRSERGAESRS
jgi:hypothetical protein